MLNTSTLLCPSIIPNSGLWYELST